MSYQKNFYQILHVQPDAPSEVIQSTYRTMMQKMKMHPDLGGDQQDAALINEAYTVLMDPDTRAEYDASLVQPAEAVSAKTNGNDSNDHSRAVIKKVFNPSKCSFCDLPHNYGQSVKPDCLCQRCASSLFPASKQSLEQSGKRIIQRIEKKWPVTFYMHWSDNRSYIGKTQDVSLNGIQMLTNTFVENGQVLKLSSHTLDAVAVVVNYRG